GGGIRDRNVTGGESCALPIYLDIVFKQTTTNVFPNNEVKHNILSIHIGPDEGLSLQLNNKKIGHAFDIEPVHLTYKPSADAPDRSDERRVGNESRSPGWSLSQ